MNVHADLTAAAARIALQIAQAPAVSAQDRARAVAMARDALGQGKGAAVTPLLATLSRRLPADSEIILLHSVALRMQQRLVEADQVLTAGHLASPGHPALLQGLAQTRYELGDDAAGLFAAAQHAAPDNLELTRNHALALISQGRSAEACGMLEAALNQHPDWLDGHKALVTLCWTNGDRTAFAASYAAACLAQPANAALWLAWFGALAQARAWAAARAVLDQAVKTLGDMPALTVSRLFLAVESGDDAAAEQLLAATASISGDVTSLCRIRNALRCGDPARAAAEAMPLLAGPSAMLYWPYLSLCWRLLGDDRAQWLDQPGSLIQTRELGWSADDLGELAALLRGLHTAQAPYIEQSVRGGTQTDRSVLLRREPILQRLRADLLDLVSGYIAQLPPPDPQHPLLCTPRSELLIEGSWSVRLNRQGYNVPHTHARGWLSTAFYVAVPDAPHLGPAPAGHIAFGMPPAELGLDLPAYRTIAPQPGRLAIFPSTMWHGTIPFEEGERLVIAFDIRRPRS